MLKSSFVAWALLGIASAVPHQILEKRVVSPDGSCGGSSAYSCGVGLCCSQFGWCGTGSGYCGSGCQSAFGGCTGTSPVSSSSAITTPPSSTSSTTSSTTSSVPSSSPSTIVKVSPDGSCGGAAGYSCTGSGHGNCCSQWGYCGSTSDYCGAGCQSNFGSCGSGSPMSSTTRPSSTSSSSSSASSATGSLTLADCLGQKSVPIILTSDSSYNTYAATYNTRLQYNPAVIVLPTTQQHISDAVVCAGKAGVKVQAKSGGHSYASFSTGGMNGIMMIDLENFQSVSVDSNGVATINAGLRLGNMASAIYTQAGRALSHGTCPGVGIGGHATHGGFGYSSRAWGLALDAIIALDVVLANGTYIKCSNTAYPDIFYAMRGAADSFGIVVNFYMQTQPAPASVINWSYSLPNMFNNVPQAVAVFQHLQDFAQNASVVDRNLGMGMYMDGQGFSISGTYFGDQNTFTSQIAPELLRTLPTPSSSSVQAVGWIQSLELLGGSSTIITPAHGYSAHDNFYAKSVTVPQSSPLTAAALTSYFTYIQNQGINPPTSWFSIINLYGGVDSQINTKDVSFAAYSDRNSLWVAQHYGFTGQGTTFPAAATTFVDGLNTAMTSQMPGTQFGGYLNYVDPNLSAADAHNLYYGASLYATLKTIKTAVDPGNVFSNPQSI